MSDSEDKLGFLFHDVARFRSIVFDDFMHAYDLTRAQWWALANLYRHDGLTQRDLAERLEIGAVTVSGLIDRLEAQGWVERRNDPADRRVKRVWLTRRAEDNRPSMSKNAAKINRISTRGLSKDQIESLVGMLRVVRSNLLDELNGVAQKKITERGKDGTT